jgi:hypothetical protein
MKFVTCSKLRKDAVRGSNADGGMIQIRAPKVCRAHVSCLGSKEMER